MMTSSIAQRVSECFIKPLHPIEDSNQICYLTGWDIAMSSMHYIQKGLLFKKPTTSDFFFLLSFSPLPLPSCTRCNARFELFYLFNYLIEFRVFLNNLFDLW